MKIEAQRTFVMLILKYGFGYEDVFFLDQYVTYRDKDGISHAVIQEVVCSEDEFVFDDSTFMSEDNVFQFSKNAIRIFKASRVLETLAAYNINIEQRFDGFNVIPFVAVKHIIYELKLEHES